MASVMPEPKHKAGALWPWVPSNRGRRGRYGFGSQPRPKAILL